MVQCLLFVGCAAEEKRILVLLPSYTDYRYETLKASAEAWGSENGLYVEVVAPFLPTAMEQQSMLEELSVQEWDGICIEPIGNMEIAPILEYLVDSGTAVVTLGGDIEVANVSIKPYSEDEMGAKLMDELILAIGENESYATLSTVDAVSILEIEEAAVARQRAAYPNAFVSMRVADAMEDFSSMELMAQNAINEHAVDGIMFYNTDDAQEILAQVNAIEAQTKLVGVGDEVLLADDLASGKISALGYYNKESLLLSALNITDMIMDGREFTTEDRIALPYEGYETIAHVHSNTWQGNDINVANNL